jgi:hypothetical protein
VIQERQFARVEPRGLVSKNATLIVDLHKPVLECTVVDMSAGGACVFVLGQAEIPDHLTFLHAGVRKTSRVIWRKGRRIGLKFYSKYGA